MGDDHSSTAPSPPSYLYHYCSNEALLAILQSATIRLSMLSQSNDYLEGRWIRQLFVEACKKRGFEDWKINRLAGSFDILGQIMGAVGFCMSTEGDLLSQWRGYADQGRGVSIGFSGTYLSQLGKVARASAAFGITLQKVEYDIERQIANIAPIVDMIAERAEKVPQFPTILTNLDEDYDAARKRHSSAVFSMALPVLLLFSHLYTAKNPAFREEQEWRLVAMVPTGDLDDGDLKACDFRVSGDRIIPFASLSMPDNGHRPIERLILGPRNNTPPEIIKALLTKYRMAGARVERSTSSFR